MRVVLVPENNLTLSPPPDWDEEAHGPCETITVQRVDDGYVVTLEMEQHEFAALMNGGKLKLKVFGMTFPPVSLFVEPAT